MRQLRKTTLKKIMVVKKKKATFLTMYRAWKRKNEILSLSQSRETIKKRAKGRNESVCKRCSLEQDLVNKERKTNTQKLSNRESEVKS